MILALHLVLHISSTPDFNFVRSTFLSFAIAKFAKSNDPFSRCYKMLC